MHILDDDLIDRLAETEGAAWALAQRRSPLSPTGVIANRDAFEVIASMGESAKGIKISDVLDGGGTILGSARGAPRRRYRIDPSGAVALAAKPTAGRRNRFEEATATDYFFAGTARAFEALGGASEDVSCVNCGAKIAHVYLTEHGPMGGDCLASITGDDMTRQQVRKLTAKLRGLSVDPGFVVSVSPAFRQGEISVSVERPSYFDEYAGVQHYRHAWTVAVVRLPEQIVHDVIADAGLREAK